MAAELCVSYSLYIEQHSGAVSVATTKQIYKFLTKQFADVLDDLFPPPPYSLCVSAQGSRFMKLELIAPFDWNLTLAVEALLQDLMVALTELFAATMTYVRTTIYRLGRVEA